MEERILDLAATKEEAKLVCQLMNNFEGSEKTKEKCSCISGAVWVSKLKDYPSLYAKYCPTCGKLLRKKEENE